MSALLVNQTSGMSEVRRYGLKSGSGADSSKPTLMTRNGRPTYAESDWIARFVPDASRVRKKDPSDQERWGHLRIVHHKMGRNGQPVRIPIRSCARTEHTAKRKLLI